MHARLTIRFDKDNHLGTRILKSVRRGILHFIWREKQKTTLIIPAMISICLLQMYEALGNARLIFREKEAGVIIMMKNR
jgi:hypothetical protein